MLKQFYANLSDRKKLTCYVRGDGSLSEKGPSPNYLDSNREGTVPSLRSSLRTPTSKRLQENSLEAKGEWKKTKTISNAFLNREDSTKVNKVRFYLVN